MIHPPWCAGQGRGHEPDHSQQGGPQDHSRGAHQAIRRPRYQGTVHHRTEPINDENCKCRPHIKLPYEGGEQNGSYV